MYVCMSTYIYMYILTHAELTASHKQFEHKYVRGLARAGVVEGLSISFVRGSPSFVKHC